MGRPLLAETTANIRITGAREEKVRGGEEDSGKRVCEPHELYAETEKGVHGDCKRERQKVCYRAWN
jgi:hypothetical protein